MSNADQTDNTQPTDAVDNSAPDTLAIAEDVTTAPITDADVSADIQPVPSLSLATRVLALEARVSELEDDVYGDDEDDDWDDDFGDEE